MLIGGVVSVINLPAIYIITRHFHTIIRLAYYNYAKTVDIMCEYGANMVDLRCEYAANTLRI